MCTRFNGIQDISVDRVDKSPESCEIAVSFKIPYVNLGFSKECDFWQSFHGTDTMSPMLFRLKEVLTRNVPLLNTMIHSELGGKEVDWKWLVSPDLDTRYYALTDCTPDLLYFHTVAEVK